MHFFDTAFLNGIRSTSDSSEVTYETDLGFLELALTGLSLEAVATLFRLDGEEAGSGWEISSVFTRR